VSEVGLGNTHTPLYNEWDSGVLVVAAFGEMVRFQAQEMFYQRLSFPDRWRPYFECVRDCEVKEAWQRAYNVHYFNIRHAARDPSALSLDNVKIRPLFKTQTQHLLHVALKRHHRVVLSSGHVKKKNNA
jgi:hypothetical protein